MPRALRAATIVVLLALSAWPAPGLAQETDLSDAAAEPGGAGGTLMDPGDADPAPTAPESSEPDRIDPGTTDPAPADPAPADPGTTDPAPADPGTTDPGPTDPGPTGDPGPDPPAPGPGVADPGNAVQGDAAGSGGREPIELGLVPAEALPGESVTVAVTGVRCEMGRGRVTVVWDGRDVADLERRTGGHADGVVTVPADAPPGEHLVEGWCVVGLWRQPLAAAAFTVLAPAPAAPFAVPSPEVAAPAAAPTGPPARTEEPAPSPGAARPRRDTATLRLLDPVPARPPEPVGTFGPVARSTFARALPALGAAFVPGTRLVTDAAVTLAIVGLLALLATRTAPRAAGRDIGAGSPGPTAGSPGAPGPVPLGGTAVDHGTVTGPGWRWPGRGGDGGGPRVPLLGVALVAVVATLLYGLLDRVDDRLAGASLAASAGLLVALAVTTLAVVLPGALYAHVVPRERVALRIRPAGLVVAGALAAGSLLAGFEPGAVYGVLAAAVVLDGRRLLPGDGGRAVLLGAACLAVVTAGAWTWWSIAVDPLVDPETVTFPALFLDAALSATVVAGLQGLALGLLPVPGLDGVRLAAWSRTAWAAAAVPAVFLFVHVLVNPDPVTVDRTGPASPTVVVALAVAAAALWAATRAATRLRTRRLA